MASFASSKYSPSKLPSAPPMRFDGPAPQSEIKRLQQLQLFVKSWVYRWISEIQGAHEIYEHNGSIHYLTYQRLRENCAKVQCYRQLQLARTLPSPSEVAILHADYNAFIRDLRSPIGNGTSEMMRGIKLRCADMIGELSACRAMMDDWVYLREATDEEQNIFEDDSSVTLTTIPDDDIAVE